MTAKTLIFSLLAALWTTIAMAGPGQGQHRAETLDALARCRAVTQDAARLRCFDAAAATLLQATERGDVVVVDRGQIRETKRTLFGLSLPRLGIFGGGRDEDADEVRQVEGVIASVGRNRDGGYMIRLQDGARWSQADGKPIAREPRPGDKVVVRKGALGSFVLSVGGQPGVKVQRVN